MRLLGFLTQKDGQPSWIVKVLFPGLKKLFLKKRDIGKFPILRSLHRIVNIFSMQSASYYGVEKKEVLTGRRGKENEPRNVAIYLCRVLRNDTLIELGKEFGMSGYSPAGSAVERVVKKMSKNRDLLEHIGKIKQSLFP